MNLFSLGAERARIVPGERLRLSLGLNVISSALPIIQIESENVAGRRRFVGGSEIEFPAEDLVTLSITDATGETVAFDVYALAGSTVRFEAPGPSGRRAPGTDPAFVPSAAAP